MRPTIEDRWTARTPAGRRRHTNRYGTGRRWRARWTDPDGTRRSATFETRAEAAAHLDTIATRPATLDAPPLTFTRYDRPLETGGLPRFSAAGYLANYLRITDPLDPLDITDGDTLRRTARDNRITYQAQALAQAVLADPPPKQSRR